MKRHFPGQGKRQAQKEWHWFFYGARGREEREALIAEAFRHSTGSGSEAGLPALRCSTCGAEAQKDQLCHHLTGCESPEDPWRLRTIAARSDEAPIFIPLKKEFFEEFERGAKTEEYREYGIRWNEGICRIGRPVTLSCGYGKHRRMRGIVSSFRKDRRPDELPGWSQCFSSTHTDDSAAVIGIELNGDFIDGQWSIIPGREL